MKIAFIFLKLENPYGGERLVLNQITELSKLGFRIDLFIYRIKKEYRRLFPVNVKIFSLGYPRIKNHNITTLLDLVLMPFLALKIKQKYDLIFATSWQSVWGAILAKRFRKANKKTKVVYQCLEPPRVAYDLKNMTLKQANFFQKIILFFLLPIIKKIDQSSVKRANHIISISNWTAMWIKKLYNKDSDVVYPGIEIERFTKYTKDEARKKLNINRNLQVFISVSKLHRRKRIDQALLLFQKYSDRNSFFYIIGSGPEKFNLEKLTQKMKLRNVKFLGQLTDNQVTLYNIAADCFIFTAKDEPFGIAPLEAKAAGCKIIPREPKVPILSWQESASHIEAIFKNLWRKEHLEK